MPGLAMAQAPNACASCLSEAACETKHDSCVAECRARLFSIDPKRAACISACSSRSAQCSLAASGACRARNLCQ
jgi:hypothetical protein